MTRTKHQRIRFAFRCAVSGMAISLALFCLIDDLSETGKISEMTGLFILQAALVCAYPVVKLITDMD